MLDFIAEAATLSRQGAMLEVGCGKGVFLRKFAARHPSWALAAVEPGAGARGRMAGLPEGTEFHPGTFESSPFLGRRFDFVASVGVLEHVTDPRAFAAAIVGCLKPGATCFISVPDFTLNPADLLTFDHLTRFTAATARRVLEEAGLTVTHQIAGQRVPMWLMGRRDAAAKAAPVPPAPPPAAAALNWLNGSLDVYAALDREVAARGGLVAVYGTGLAAFGAVAQDRLKADRIDCFIDDNPHLQGSERLGKPVVSLEAAATRGVTDVTFSASPAYLQRMEAKARAGLPPGVRLWPLPHND
jgi:SAM-dependent methyltransferase